MTGPIIDAHHHIWRLAATPWLQGPAVPRIFGAYEPLRRDYDIDEYMADAVPCGVVKSVFVQVNVAPGGEVDEAAWVQQTADRHGFPHAVTAFADLAAPDVGDVLDRQMAVCRLRAVRQQIHWHANPQYRFAARPDVMNDPAWRRGLAEVERRGLMFELQVFASQMADAAALLRAFPGVTFILTHAGMLEDRTPAGWALWRAGMVELASCPNVATKVSGLGTFDRACSVERWKPIVTATIDLFGPGRCLFGSNFPIEKLWTDYATLIATVRACLADLPEADRQAVLHDTAQRLYGL
ncbi:putative TIM-barrel fold metal-dependent hydrolase [Stella humosa]|uniref:Putative TIM-barrel fold metal-dependent hydrolase n=1 Tax=Stella humosa TaxID=94 RepID=A0A3N1M9X6_9PROT|nr:amidohydrolase family protein [Stella humosa]ROP99599.1 putative TIM-barrel fold metal-dependent hydrolase [Stella humosa]BBK31176.1 amidohydrolase [Stella humosa]